MNRRRFLRWCGVSLLSSTVLPSRAHGKTQRRNVLLLLFDDLRHDTFSFVSSLAQTPQIDALQSESTHFVNACTTTGLCSPSRAALFTGRWGHRTGQDDNCHIWHSRLTRLGPEHTTLLEWAVAAGYGVGYFGKWHLGPDGPVQRGAHRFSTGGFERWGNRPIRTPDFDGVKRYYEEGANFPDKPEYYGTRRGTYRDTPTRAKVKDGVEFLQEAAQEDRPFFLTVSFSAPHPPYVVPQPYDRMYDPKRVELPVSLTDSYTGKPGYHRHVLWPWHDIGHMSADDWRRLQAHYYGFVTMADRAVGEILDAVKQCSLWDETLIVLAGDQGSMLGEHKLYDKGPYCYDELMRIPLLIRVPFMRSREVKRHVSLMDVNQTLVEWMDLRPDVPNVDSRSLFPLIRHGDEGWREADEAYYRYEWYNGSWYGIRAIRTSEYKYCWNPVGVDELYDLCSDPHELHNLIDRENVVDTRAELQKRLLNHLHQIQDPAHQRLARHANEGVFSPAKSVGH